MKAYKVAVISGDGIGPEIIAAALPVLSRAAALYGFKIEYAQALMGGCAIDECGEPLPDSTVKTCLQSDAVLLGAVGGPKWDDCAKRPETGLLGIRAALGLFANLRPAVVYAELADSSPLKSELLGEGLDLLVVRELTGGIYFGERGERDGGAFDTEFYTPMEIERIARTAFSAARKRRKEVCSVDKANVLRSSKLWRATVERVARDYPDVKLRHMYVDNAAMQLVRCPTQFDVILTNNIFGDILSDEASQITGSIGMLPSASLGGGTLGLYEPIHGSAPDIAGKNAANPLATILSCAMLLRYSLDEQEAAGAIERAVKQALADGLRTSDLVARGEPALGTAEMGKAVLDRMEAR